MIKLVQPVEVNNIKYSVDESPVNVGDDKKQKKERLANGTLTENRNVKQNQIYRGIEINSNPWIEMACEKATDSVKNHGGPFGAVVVQIDNETNQVLRYWRAGNQVTLSNDPTAHAEVVAIRSACASLGVFNLGEINKSESKLPQQGDTSRCEIFCSCEPCPMCYAATYWSRMAKIYFAATRFDAAREGVNFSDEAIYNELKAPYVKRNIKSFQCDSPNSLKAFELWKSIDKTDY